MKNNINNVPDLNTLLEQAEDIMKEKGDINIDPTISVTLENWNGKTMDYVSDNLDYVYWDYDADEIGFNTYDDAGDHLISELSDNEQRMVCLTIIRSRI